MKAEAIGGANCIMLGNQKDVADLPVVKTRTGFCSQWRPTREEISRMVLGAPVHLYIMGIAHPPVAIEVPELDPASFSTNTTPATLEMVPEMSLCSDCPNPGYADYKRCAECPRRAAANPTPTD